MTKNEMIKIALGDRYEEGREIAEMVVDYMTTHPNWASGCKNSAIRAIDLAISEIYGHPLSFYSTRCRTREFVDIRQMGMYLYYSITNSPLRKVGEMFGRNHSTAIYAIKQVRTLLKIDKMFRSEYELLEGKTKNYL